MHPLDALYSTSITGLGLRHVLARHALPGRPCCFTRKAPTSTPVVRRRMGGRLDAVGAGAGARRVGAGAPLGDQRARDGRRTAAAGDGRSRCLANAHDQLRPNLDSAGVAYVRV